MHGGFDARGGSVYDCRHDAALSSRTARPLVSTPSLHEPQTVLVTGASSGIGRDLAHIFADGGYDLVLVARREAALRTLATDLTSRHRVRVQVLPRDLTQPETPRTIHQHLTDEGTVIDVVVNNAGFGLRGRFADLSLENQLRMIALNVSALTHLTRLFLPQMVDRNRGGILNVASTAAFTPGPLMAVYYATKAYVLSFTEALATELAATDLRVTCLAPGPTATEFATAADMEESNLFRLGTLPSMPVARAGYDGWQRGRTIVVPGLVNKVSVGSMRLAPRFLLRRVLSFLNSKRPKTAEKR